jgi:transposase
MQKVIRQCAGIDCAKEELVVSFGLLKEDFEQLILSNTSFKNTPAGFEKLVKWVDKLKDKEVQLVMVIEATGVYHERASVFLTERGYHLSVILPNRAKAFFQTLKNKTITDKSCGQMLCRLGLEKRLDQWQPPHEVYNTLKQLTRERSQLIMEQTQNKNQLHAEKSGAWVNKQSVKRTGQRLQLLERQLQDIVHEIADVLEEEEWLKEKIERLCTIKGIAMLTAVTIVAESAGFNLIRNKKQLVSYAGLDVKEKSSGTSVNGRPRISKAGNAYLRAALYFPSLTAMRLTPSFKDLFVRTVSRHGIKKKSLVAVQRKMLELVYVLWKNDTVYDPEYVQKRAEKKGLQEQPLAN